MGDSPIPPEVEHFLVAHIPSVAHLEALLLLREVPSVAWTTEALAARLFIAPAVAARVRTDLTAHALVADTPERGAVAYAPASPALATAVEQLAATYRTRLVAVAQFIHARQPASSIQQFADAFKLRKD